MASISPDFIVDARRLRVLQELSTRGSVTDAAAALHLTPSAVSQQLKVLARSAGVPLVERYGRGVRLTPQAKLLLHHAGIVAQQLEAARRDLDAHSVGLTGQVTIGAPATAVSGLVAPVLAALTDERPGVRIDVVEIEDATALEALVAGDLDVLLFIRGAASPADGDVRVWQTVVHRDPMRLMVPADHPLGSGSVALAAVAGERFVAATTGTCAEVSRAACADAGFSPDVRHRCADWSAFSALVAAGAGVALVPTLAFAVAPPGTRMLDLAEPVPVRTLVLAVRAGSETSPLLQPVLAALTGRAEALRAREGANRS